MAETGTFQASNIFAEWAKKYAPGLVSPQAYTPPAIEANTPWTPGAVPGARPAPMLATPTTFPASATPTPQAPVAVPPAPERDPQIAEENALDAAVANQDQWTGPTPGPPRAPGAAILDSLKSGVKTFGEGVSNLSQPVKMGLLGTGLSMMATPPRAIPYSNTEILGKSGLAGLGIYEKALEDKRKADLMVQTADEHALAQGDRHQANLDRADYYKSSADTRALNASTLEDLRKVNADAKISMDKPIPDSLAKTYSLPIGTTIRDYKQMESGLIAAAKPEKEVKPDAFTEWYNSFGKAGPTRADLATWHRGPGSGAGGGTDGGPGKVGAIGQVNRELGALYLPYAKSALEAKGPAGMEEYKGMVAMFQTTDQFGGTVNDARLRESLSSEQRKEYDFVKRKGQDYSRTMTPANAVARAQEDWQKKNPAKAAPANTPGSVLDIPWSATPGATARPAATPAAATSRPEASKQVNGVWYDKIGGKWYQRETEAPFNATRSIRSGP